MRAKAENLIFISRIKRDGSGVLKINKKDLKHFEENQFAAAEKFELNILSLSEKTFIASGFNSYVVKLKPTHNP